MNRQSKNSYFNLQPSPVVTAQVQTHNKEKNTLITIMAKYLAKQTDKTMTIADLTALEKELSKPA